MRSLILSVFIVLGFSACKSKKRDKVRAAQVVKVVQGASTFNIDLNTAKLIWRGYKLVKSNASSHWGHIDLVSGSLQLKDGRLVGGTFTIDMNSMRAEDLKDKPDRGEKLEQHLKSADFFDTAQHPTARFVFTGVQQLPGNRYSISGNLTMKGITKNISFEAALEKLGDQKVVFTTDPFEIDRKQWNVSFDHPAQDVVVKDHFEMLFSAEATKV